MFKEKLNGTIAYFQSVEENRVKGSGTDRFGQYQRVAKSQEVEGVEIDWVFQPNPRWQTVIFGAYMKALANSLDATDPKFDKYVPMSDVPQWQGGFFTKYSFDEGPFDGLEIGLGMEAVDDSRTEPPSPISPALLPARAWSISSSTRSLTSWPPTSGPGTRRIGGSSSTSITSSTVATS